MSTIESQHTSTVRELTAGTITVPLDPARPAPPALRVARAIARQAGYGVELVAAVPTGLDERTVDRFLHSHTGGQPAADWADLGPGDAADAVLAHVDDSLPALICLESRARRAAAELALGSVSEAIVRRATVPVLACGPHLEPEERYTRLVVGLDGSELAERAMDEAMRFATTLGASLALLEVLPPDVTVPSDVLETSYLARTRAHAPVRIDDYDTVHHRRPAQALIEAACDEPGSIIVVGTHGRTGWQRLRLGSVALDVVRHAPCPVLVVPPEVSRTS